MQIQQLAYFVAVAEHRHFTRAAQAQHVAQPSLSKQIAALEAELGGPLFSRARGNIALTPAGEALLPLAERVLADLELAQTTVRDVVGLKRGSLRLGATPSLSTALLPAALRRYQQRYPGIRLLLEEGGSRDLVGHLANGALDVALIILPLRPTDPSLQTVPLLNEPLVVAVPPRHPLVALKSVHITDLRDVPLVMFREGYDLRAVTLAACRQAGFEPILAVEGGEMDAVLQMVQAGLGASIVPTMVAAGMPNLRLLPLSRPQLTRTVAVAHRRDVSLQASASRFVRMLSEVLHERDTADDLGAQIRVLV